MPDFDILSHRYPDFSVRLGNCTREHAGTVVAQLMDEPTVPSDLRLVELDAPSPPRKRTFLDRLLRR